MTIEFDDSRLDDPEALEGIDDELRRLAGAGARVRVLAGAAAPSGAQRLALGRPRGVLALGAEARLVRAVLEPVCPVPFVAWGLEGLPAWVGPLDLVVVLASGGSDAWLTGAVAEAVRRGAAVMVAAAPGSPIAERAASRSTLLVPTVDDDPLASVAVVLDVLHDMGLGPAVDPERIAACADRVAEDCSPHRNLAENPAKELALALGDAQPLVWGGSVLAARAARRIAEALRQASGRPALSADADALLPVVEACQPADVFRDPFDDEARQLACVLVAVDDASTDQRVRAERSRLLAAAESHGVRVCTIRAGGEDPTADQSAGFERYVELLQQGRYAAQYLHLGLGETR